MTDRLRPGIGDNPYSTPDLAALVALLADPSPKTATAVRSALLKAGDDARRPLMEATRGPDARQRARARQLLQDLDQSRALESLRAFLALPDGELQDGLGRIDDVLGEGVNSTRQRQAVAPTLRGWSDWLRRRCAQDTTEAPAEEQRRVPTFFMAGALRRLLVSEEGFRRVDDDFHHQAHASLSRTIADRRGLPLTVCAVFALVARGAGFEAGLLPFPGQVLLSLGPESDRLIVDAYEGGALMSESDCQRRLESFRAPSTYPWRRVSPDRQMVIRQVRNLGAAMERHGRHALAREAVQIADGTRWN